MEDGKKYIPDVQRLRDLTSVDRCSRINDPDPGRPKFLIVEHGEKLSLTIGNQNRPKRGENTSSKEYRRSSKTAETSKMFTLEEMEIRAAKC